MKEGIERLAYINRLDKSLLTTEHLNERQIIFNYLKLFKVIEGLSNGRFSFIGHDKKQNLELYNNIFNGN